MNKIIEIGDKFISMQTEIEQLKSKQKEYRMTINKLHVELDVLKYNTKDIHIEPFYHNYKEIAMRIEPFKRELIMKVRGRCPMVEIVSLFIWLMAVLYQIVISK